MSVVYEASGGSRGIGSAMCLRFCCCRFRVNDTLLDEYHYNIHARSNITDKTCDALCKVETICAVSNVNIEEYFKCIAKQ